jgi:hypothetical protein
MSAGMATKNLLPAKLIASSAACKMSRAAMATGRAKVAKSAAMATVLVQKVLPVMASAGQMLAGPMLRVRARRVRTLPAMVIARVPMLPVMATPAVRFPPVNKPK